SSQGGGGLLVVQVFGNGSITNNILARNLAATGASPSLTSGGGILTVAVSGKIDLTNNTLVDNQSAGEGGGLLVTFDADGGEVNITNNIIHGNLGAPGIECTKDCDDIVVLDDPDTNNIGAKVSVSHNDFSTLFFQCQESQGCSPQQTVDAPSNIDKDPLF